MIDTHQDIFIQFIKFGAVANERERKKMVSIISDWQPIPLEVASIDQKYLQLINDYILDKQINAILTEQPQLRGELIKKLFSLLEIIEEVAENDTGSSEEEWLMSMYDNIENKQILYDEIFPEKGPYSVPIHYESDILLSKTIKNYESELRSIENYKKRLKDEKFQQLHKKILRNWQKLVDRKTSSTLGAQLQQAGAQSKEQTLINSFSQLSVQEFRDTWEPWNDYKNHLKETYRKRDFDLNRYQNLFIEIKNTEIKLDRAKLKIANDKFITKWKEELSLAKIQHKVRIIDDTRKEFLKTLYAKIKELRRVLKLLTPFIYETMPPGRLWDLSPGEWHKVDFSLLEKYAHILEGKEEIQDLAELLGKFRKATAELEKEEFEKIENHVNYRTAHTGKEELVGITESDDLNNLMPTELALFSDLETEDIFYKRFAEKKLQTFQYISKEQDFEQKAVIGTRQKETETDKGPFIIAIDTSGSMHGEPEFLAKVIAFAITRIALREKRKGFLISFSTSIKTIELTDIQNSLTKLIEFLQMSFEGGTDASEAVLETLKQMKKNDYQKADLLIISDGIFATLEDKALTKIQQLKKRGNRFNALMIGESYNETALAFCDDIWQYDPASGSLKDLIKQMKGTL